MSKKQKTQSKEKLQNFSRVGEIVKSLPTWLKFAGLLVPILGLLISYLSYTLERQKYSDDIKVLVSTESNLNIEAGKMNVYPPMSISYMTKKGLACGRDLIISNTGGISTALVGIKGHFSHESFSQPIVFETIGNEAYLGELSNTLPKGLSSFMVTLLNDNPWLLTEEIFEDTDILAFPVEVEAHSSFKVRVALNLYYETEHEVNIANSQFDDKGRPKLSLQFITSTSKITESIEFECFNGILFFPEITTFSTPQAVP